MTEVQFFSATYYGVTRHTTAEANTDLLLPGMWAFGKERAKRTCRRTSNLVLQLPFSFTLLEEVFFRFIQVLLKPSIGNSL